MTTNVPSLCASCRFIKKDGTCAAFPDGIPDDILFWGGDHRGIVDGQVGTTTHILKDGKEQDFEDWVFTYVVTDG
jgi:hypothetical protein